MYLSFAAAPLAIHRSTLMCRNGPWVMLFSLAAASVNATFVAAYMSMMVSLTCGSAPHQKEAYQTKGRKIERKTREK